MSRAPNELGPDEYGRKWEQLKVGKELRSRRQAEGRGPRAGEYAGVEGMIAPAPHDVANYPHEQLMLIRNMDPAARADEPDATLLPAGVPEPVLIKPGKSQIKFNSGQEIKGK